MELNGKQYALLISSLVMMLLLLTLFNIHLSTQQKKERLIELQVEEIVEENIQLPKESSRIKTHMAYNESVKSKFEEEIKEFKTLEELREGKRAEESEEEQEEDASDNTSNTAENESIDGGIYREKQSEKTPEKSKESEGDNSTHNTVLHNNTNRHSSISYSLVNRIHRYLPNPVYTCSAQGKIVINIRVNSAGKVTRADFNRKSSTSANGCLVDQAITYALKATFNSREGSGEQQGTITYLFQG
ncbi:hypothetical protein [Sinomicrobium sp.]